jgi:protein-tyrosine phosphatase
MISVLFVCLGNICRSPLAEGVFAHLVETQPLAVPVAYDSAGIGGWHAGELPDRRARAVASAHGLALTHRARQVKVADFAEFDYILAMDNDNLHALRELAIQAGPRNRAQLSLLRVYDPVPGSMEVDDPYYGNTADFEECYQTVARSIQAFWAMLNQRHPS